MTVINLNDSERIETLHPLFKTAFDYIKSHDLLHEPLGRIELQGDRLFINNSQPTLVDRDKQVIEAHRKYIDIHVPLEGSETIGWKPVGTIDTAHCTVRPYDDEADCALYACPSDTYFTLHPGQALIVWPEDGHAPIIGSGTMRKAIVKVLL